MDTISKTERSALMSRVRSRNTKPELLVRSLVHRMGYRFRLHKQELPGRPDLVFSSKRKVIFVHGCFWHQHPDPECKGARQPKSHIDYWGPKLEKNMLRDKSACSSLEDLGWSHLVIWECETKEIEKIQIKVKIFIESN